MDIFSDPRLRAQGTCQDPQFPLTVPVALHGLSPSAWRMCVFIRHPALLLSHSLIAGQPPSCSSFCQQGGVVGCP